VEVARLVLAELVLVVVLVVAVVVLAAEILVELEHLAKEIMVVELLELKDMAGLAVVEPAQSVAILDFKVAVLVVQELHHLSLVHP
jgi:hypothetical protein